MGKRFDVEVRITAIVTISSFLLCSKVRTIPSRFPTRVKAVIFRVSLDPRHRENLDQCFSHFFVEGTQNSKIIHLSRNK